MRDYLEKLFEKQMPQWSPGDEEEFKYSRSGSGVIIREDGYLVTSNHVIAEVNPEDIEITLPDGRSFGQVALVGTDDLTDLAVLKVEGKDLPHLNWGDSEKLEVGDIVVAVGNPLEFNNSVSEGIVSAKHRVIKKAPIEDLIQTTAMINPGNSGGALVNLDSELVGINMAIATSTGMWSGLGFAIPSKTARGVTDQIIASGKVGRGYLGIEMSAAHRQHRQAARIRQEHRHRGEECPAGQRRREGGAAALRHHRAGQRPGHPRDLRHAPQCGRAQRW